MKKKLLILGAGFGLYGYLPAAIKNGYSVYTLDRYQSFISSRNELSQYISRVRFVKEEFVDFHWFDGVVIARIPENQLDLVDANLDFKGHIFLEKPLGTNSDTHEYLVDRLSLCNTDFSVAYLFRYLDWYRHVLGIQGEDCSINIDWRIPDGGEESWKRDNRLGGGLASYYGIHLFSMLVDIGGSPHSMEFRKSSSSLIISGVTHSTSFRFSVSYSQIPSFQVKIRNISGVRSWNLLSPFGPLPTAGISDPRLPGLSEYLQNWGVDETFGDRIIHERKVIEFRRIVERLM